MKGMVEVGRINALDFIDPNVIQAFNYIDSTKMIYGITTEISKIESGILSGSYDTHEDFEWYTSGEVDTSSYKGKHIAIWKKQIVGSGQTPLEAERIAKTYHKNSKPAIVYVPKDDEVDTIF